MRIVDIEPGMRCDLYPAEHNPHSDYMRVSAPLSYTLSEVLEWIDAQEDDGPEVAIVGHAHGFTTPRSTELIEELEDRGLTVYRRAPAAFGGSDPEAVEGRIRDALGL